MTTSTWDVSDLVAQLPVDGWRVENGFSEDMDKCNQILFGSARTRSEKIKAVNQWLAENQPYLFGQMEARQARLEFCLLTENDLELCDQDIRAKIQYSRKGWQRKSLSGATHGFLIVAVARSIAFAVPGPQLQTLAKKLCELYLDDCELDRIYHDELLLRGDGNSPFQRAWKVGVNYFSAQGDGRWWHDHRFPGGIAFSMNSVGHMARTRAETQLARNPGLLPEDVPRERLVYWALPTAMKTIGPPIAGSTRGTWLVDRGEFPEDREPPSFEVRERYFGGLAHYSENRYKGRYHTDFTLPSKYFADVWKEEDLDEFDELYFTYLHSDADPDYRCMGLGLDFLESEVTPNDGASPDSERPQE